MVESGSRVEGAKLASQESLPREGRAAASCGDGVRLAMGAVVEWADGGVRRGWRRFGGIGSAAQGAALIANGLALLEEPSPLGPRSASQSGCDVCCSENNKCSCSDR